MNRLERRSYQCLACGPNATVEQGIARELVTLGLGELAPDRQRLQPLLVRPVALRVRIGLGVIDLGQQDLGFDDRDRIVGVNRLGLGMLRESKLPLPERWRRLGSLFSL